MFEALCTWPAVRKALTADGRVAQPGEASASRAYVNFLHGYTLDQARGLKIVLPGGHPEGEKGHLRLPPGAMRNLAFFTRAEEFRLFELDGLGDAHLREIAAAMPSSVHTLMVEGLDDDGSAVRHFAGKTHLRTFNLYFNPRVGDSALAPLGTLPNLESLNLSGNPHLTGSGFEHLRKLSRLKHLLLNDTGVDDTTLQALAGLPLETLGLNKTRATLPGLQRLLQQGPGLPRLRKLSLKGTPIADPHPLAREGLQIEI